MSGFSIAEQPTLREGWLQTEYHEDDLFPSFLSGTTPEMYGVKEEEKESAMCYNCAPTTKAQSTVNVTAVTEQPKDNSLSFLKDRLRTILYEKRSEISVHFDKKERPTTLNELQEWLSKGNFHFDIPKTRDQDASFSPFPDCDDYEDTVASPWRYFGWGKKAPDGKARLEAQEKLQDAWQTAVDTVTVLTDEATRLKVLNEFKAAKFV